MLPVPVADPCWTRAGDCSLASGLTATKPAGAGQARNVIQSAPADCLVPIGPARRGFNGRPKLIHSALLLTRSAHSHQIAHALAAAMLKLAVRPGAPLGRS